MNEPASLRERLIEAIERRAALQDDAVRHVLKRRLAALIESYDAAPAAAPADAPTAAAMDAAGTAADGAAPGPLRALIDRLDAHAATRGRTRVALDGAPSPMPAAEPEVLRTLRRTWSTLQAEQRLTQSLARLPENAGPLNSHHLVHRALTLMREQSPEYLSRFVGYVDALLWLDALNEGR
ncbi:DUF2894 domain-containing protein [Aquabacterium humicola]|uniref:DUF2894 domain-containing protein n=1 Tax=Aquabacterium humicola TaxID=3237377 RepID=UPI0025436E54|nr:DUF2894 domain-containing protein [Rubrivivax pictus]